MNNIRFILLPPNSTHLCQPLYVAIFRPIKRSWRKTLEDWKNSNSGAIPKCEYPKLLKTTIERLKDNMSDNIKSGFCATSIFSFDKQKVLNKIPSLSGEDELIESHVETSWTETFLEILSDLRNPKHKLMQPRGKKLNVPASKSIRIEDIKKNYDPDDPDIVVENQAQNIYSASTSNVQEEVEIVSQNSDSNDSDPRVITIKHKKLLWKKLVRTRFYQKYKIRKRRFDYS